MDTIEITLQRADPINFPKSIAEKYYFVRELNLPKVKYRFAIYDTGEKKCIAKMWTKNNFYGKSKNNIINEIRFYEKYSKVINDTGIIKVPNFHLYHEDENTTILLTDYIEGVQLLACPKNQKVKHYRKLIDSLSGFFLSLNLVSDKAGVKNVSPIRCVASLPILALVSMIKNPRSIKQITQLSTLAFTKLITNLTSQKSGLVHRDINGGNVLVTDSDLFLIDYELYVESFAAYDYANTLYSLWNFEGTEFFKETLSYCLKKGYVDKNLLLGTLAFAYLYDNSFGTGKDTAGLKVFTKLLIRSDYDKH